MLVLKIIVISTGCITIAKALYACWEGLPTKRDVASRVLSHSGDVPQVIPETLRSQFAALPVVRQAVVQTHTHGEAAADRSTGSLFADMLGDVVGLEPYFVQCSRADERAGRLGSRNYYWSKDLTVTPKKFAPPTESLLVLVDVDHYVDMPQFLIDQFRPVLLYTFQPHVVARANREYSFTFNGQNEVQYRVSGGGEYQHLIWNYGQDHVLVQTKFMGVVYRSAVYLIERRATSDDHELILLTPVKRWWGVGAFVSSWLYGSGLKRLSVVDGNYLRMRVHTKKGVMVSTGKVGQYLEVTTSAENDCACSIMAGDSKYEINVASVEKFVKDKAKALMLWSYHKGKRTFVEPVVYPVEKSNRGYQYNPSDYDPSWKPSMVAFMSPILNEGFSPDCCPNNDRAYVDSRILELRSEPSPPITPLMLKIMQEFVGFVVPDEIKHKGVPCDMAEVWERQNRPTQRRILYMAQFNAVRGVNGSFMKKEAYSEPKDPRPITTIEGPTKADYSCYTYPFSEHLKTFDWYAFGKTPIKVADRVKDVCSGCKYNVVPTDASRWDGRVKEAMRVLELMLLIAFYSKEYHREVTELHSRHKDKVVYTTFGVSYITEDERESGNPETACFNSSGNCFNAYYCKRRTVRDGRYLSPQQAWAELGIYGGDDGLTPDIDPVLYTKHSAELAVVLKAKEVKRGEMGIEMLGRVYGPDVWFGDCTSVCDLPRQLSKLHLTVSLPPQVTAADKLFQKAFAFYLTDKNTPVLGPFVTKVVQLGTAVGMEYHNLCDVWGGGYSQEVQYPNEPAEWMIGYARLSLPNASFTLFDKFIDDAKTLSDMLSPPLLACPLPPIPQAKPVVVEGEVVPPKKKAKKEPKAAPVGERVRKPRWKKKTASGTKNQ